MILPNENKYIVLYLYVFPLFYSEYMQNYVVHRLKKNFKKF